MQYTDNRYDALGKFLFRRECSKRFQKFLFVTNWVSSKEEATSSAGWFMALIFCGITWYRPSVLRRLISILTSSNQSVCFFTKNFWYLLMFAALILERCRGFSQGGGGLICLDAEAALCKELVLRRHSNRTTIFVWFYTWNIKVIEHILLEVRNFPPDSEIFYSWRVVAWRIFDHPLRMNQVFMLCLESWWFDKIHGWSDRKLFQL